jgi:formyl-CoA transferase
MHRSALRGALPYISPPVSAERSPASRPTVEPVDTGVGPLQGVRVLELGSVVAGPFAGRLLADFGADVVKVEAPDRPDPLRSWGRGAVDGHKLWWPVHARGKRLVTLDLRAAAGQELFLRLVERSDVVIENFRPGTLERWNLGYDRMSAVNPGVVLARISGYGQTGPYREQAGYASVAEAMGGLRHITGHPGEAPPRMGISLGDSLAGMFAVQGILAALHWRDHGGGGQGQVVDVSLLESCLAMLESTLPEYDRLGLVRGPEGSRLPGVAPSNVFCSRDRRWIVIAANQDTVFRRLAGAMGRPELADDPRFATHDARGDNQLELEDMVAAWAAERTGDEIVGQLTAAGVVCGPVYTAADIVTDPQVHARDMLLPHDDEHIGTFLGPGVVPKLTRTPGGFRWSGRWEPGTHNAEVYGELLGLDAEALAELREESVI